MREGGEGRREGRGGEGRREGRGGEGRREGRGGGKGGEERKERGGEERKERGGEERREVKKVGEEREGRKGGRGGRGKKVGEDGGRKGERGGEGTGGRERDERLIQFTLVITHLNLRQALSKPNQISCSLSTSKQYCHTYWVGKGNLFFPKVLR